jgi:hypothetical protein
MRFCSLESDRQKIRYGNCERKNNVPISSCWSSWTPEIQGGRKKEIAKFEIKFPQLAVYKM